MKRDAVAQLGDEGRRLWRLARRHRRAQGDVEHEAKSLSAEVTFEYDVADRGELERDAVEPERKGRAAAQDARNSPPAA